MLNDEKLLINTLASNNCFSYRNIFQNSVDALTKLVDAFLSKSLNFVQLGSSDKDCSNATCGTNTY